jgi:hypothetical protein
MFMYREIYMTHRLVEDHANGRLSEDGTKEFLGINDLSADEKIEATVCDHDLEDRMTLERHGIRRFRPYKDIFPRYSGRTNAASADPSA